MKRQFPLAAFLLSFTILTEGQQQSAPPPPQGTPAKERESRTIVEQDDAVRISVNLVQVDVTVTDDKGRQVTDLRPEDFEVYEEGRAQQITNFSYVTPPQPGAPVAATAPSAPLGPGAGKSPGSKSVAPPPVPPARLRPEKVRRTVALVVDDLGLSHESSVRVRQALRKFVDEQMQPGDLFAVIRTGAGMGALQQFTTDKRQLHSAIERVRYNLASRSQVSTFAPIGGDGVAAAIDRGELAMRHGRAGAQMVDERAAPSFLRQPGEELEQFREELFSVGTLGALNFVVRGLKDLPGRKSVILFSDGFKLYTEDPGNRRIIDSLRRLTDLANRASVIFYTIDPRGLEYFGMTAADNMNGPVGVAGGAPGEANDPNKMSQEKLAILGGAEGAAERNKRMAVKPTDPNWANMERMERDISDRRTKFFETQHGLSFLATQTGGFLVKNRNDIAAAINRVMGDQAGFYLIGYRPDDATFKGAGGTRFRNISVKVKRAGLGVRTRTGFYGFTDEESRRPARRTPADQLFAALTSPFNSGDIRLRMNAMFGHDTKRGPFTQSLLHINGQDITFGEPKDGWREAKIDVMAVTFGDNGKVVDQDDRSYTIQLGEKDFQRATSAGFVYTVTLPVKKAGAYQLRIAVRDHATERVGSANQFIDVPDVRKGRLTLSGVSVRGVPAGQTRSGVVTLAVADDPQASSASRRLRRGMVMEYGYYVYNARLDKTKSRAQLETQLRLFRDGQLVYAGKVNEVSAAPSADGKSLVAGGSLQIGSDLQPGQYVLQVVVVDRLAREQHGVATQWLDFDIVE